MTTRIDFKDLSTRYQSCTVTVLNESKNHFQVKERQRRKGSAGGNGRQCCESGMIYSGSSSDFLRVKDPGISFGSDSNYFNMLQHFRKMPYTGNKKNKA